PARFASSRIASSSHAERRSEPDRLLLRRSCFSNRARCRLRPTRVAPTRVVASASSIFSSVSQRIVIMATLPDLWELSPRVQPGLDGHRARVGLAALVQESFLLYSGGCHPRSCHRQL